VHNTGNSWPSSWRSVGQNAPPQAPILGLELMVLVESPVKVPRLGSNAPVVAVSSVYFWLTVNAWFYPWN
jgi:hypothetical protein